MKPTKWHRDEIILALDLYYDIEPKEMDYRNHKMIELSEILNKLPIHNVSRKTIKEIAHETININISNNFYNFFKFWTTQN